MNLFFRLRPTRSTSHAGDPPSFGREDYLTEVVAAVLEADTRAGGGLTQRVVRTLFGIEVAEPIEVRTQASFARSEGGTSSIDLLVETEREVVFIENKTGSALGIRSTDTGEAIGQLEKYDRELDHHPGKERYLALVVWAPPDLPSDLAHLAPRPYAFWWELWEAVRHADDTGDAYADGLRTELVEFFRLMELDDPRPITDTSVRQAVQRVLAMAIARAARDGVAIFNPRPSTTHPAYWFELLEANPDATGRTCTLGFEGHELYAMVLHSGYRSVELSPHFFSQSVEQQVAALAAVLAGLRIAPRDERRSAKMDRAHLLDQLGELSEPVEALFQQATELGWKLRFGTAEVALQHPRCLPVMYLSTVYSSGASIRIWCGDHDIQDEVAREIQSAEIAPRVAFSGQSLKLDLAESRDGLHRLPSVLLLFHREE